MKISELFETLSAGMLRRDIQDVLPRTVVIPALQNNDTYKQYRYLLALASARAVEQGDVSMDQASAWNENMAVVCYTAADEETARLASKLMGVQNKHITTSTSQESSHIQKISPVRTFKDIE